MPRAIVIFGAAVGPDGRASPSLRRRTLYAAHAAREAPDDPVFCSGGVGRHGGSEASIMAEILRDAGIDHGRLTLDEHSRDTLENVIAAARFVRAEGLDGAVICTDRYHHARVRMMFAVLGVRSWPGPMAEGRAGTRLAYWLAMHARECAAYPYDLAIVLARRAELLRTIEA